MQHDGSYKDNVDGGTPFELFTSMQDTNYTIGVSDYQVQLTFNFGQDSTFVGQETAGGNTDRNGKGDFHSALPSSHTDYLAVCSANLSDTTISPNKSSQADDHFDTITYSGAGQIKQLQQIFKQIGCGLKKEQQMAFNINYLIHQDYTLHLVQSLVKN